MRTNKTKFNKKVGVIITPETYEMLITMSENTYRGNKSFAVEESIKHMYNAKITSNEISK